MARKMLADTELDRSAAEEATATHYDFDLFVIGAGSGGVRAARFSANNGAKVVVKVSNTHPKDMEVPPSGVDDMTTLAYLHEPGVLQNLKSRYYIDEIYREQFPFLEEYRCSRSRTTFYYTIGWLIFMEDSSIKFKTSMEPLLQVFRTLESTPDSMFRTDAVKFTVIGLMREVTSRRSYGLLFDWLYPAHMPLLLRGISHWFDTPEVQLSPHPFAVADAAYRYHWVQMQARYWWKL